MKPLTAYPRHKRKKLLHMRTKNSLINGAMYVVTSLKLSKSLHIDETIEAINNEVEATRYKIYKGYKALLKECDYKIAEIDDDFIRELKTIKITLYNK